MWQTKCQPKALGLIERSYKMGSLAHAYLFIGPPHVGKTTLALDLARALNCKGADPPCYDCQSCRRITSNKHADVMFIGVKGEKTQVEIGIDEIKGLQQSASLPPFEGDFKVFVIDGAENLSSEAANCLLKTLEEPLPKVMIILLTTDETRLLPTVVSRCQRVELKPIPGRDMEKELMEARGVSADDAKLLARLSEGCLGWALLASAGDSQIQQRKQRLSELFSLVGAGLGKRFTYVAQFENDRKLAQEVINLWLCCWRDLMLTKSGISQDVVNIDCISDLETWASVLSLAEIKDFIFTLRKSLRHIQENANLRLVLEILMLDMPRKEVKAEAGKFPPSASL